MDSLTARWMTFLRSKSMRSPLFKRKINEHPHSHAHTHTHTHKHTHTHTHPHAQCEVKRTVGEKKGIFTTQKMKRMVE